MTKIRTFIRQRLRAATREYLGPITHFDVSGPVIALTFDDGPHPEYTPRVLDILGRYGICATFFMIGQAAAQYPHLVQRVGASGHAIGNHSWDHSLFTALPSRERRWQIRACERAIAPHGVRLFRPPWGKLNLAASLDAFSLGYTVIHWNLDAGDWRDGTSEQMADLLSGRLGPGSVALLHDGLFEDAGPNGRAARPVDRRPMLRALELFLDRDGHRFRFATIPEICRLGRAVRRSW